MEDGPLVVMNANPLNIVGLCLLLFITLRQKLNTYAIYL